MWRYFLEKRNNTTQIQKLNVCVNVWCVDCGLLCIFFKLRNRIKKSLLIHNKYKFIPSIKYYNKYSALDIFYISAYYIYRVQFCIFKYLINAQRSQYNFLLNNVNFHVMWIKLQTDNISFLIALFSCQNVALLASFLRTFKIQA